MARKKRKISKHYTISVASDYSGRKTKVYRCKFNFVSVAIICSAVILAMACFMTYFFYTQLNLLEKKVGTFEAMVDEQKSTITELGNRNAELEDEIAVIENTLALSKYEEKLRMEEEAEKCIPSLFPIEGAAYSSSQDKVNSVYSKKKKKDVSEGEDPLAAIDFSVYAEIAVFYSEDLVDMVAAGAGTVVYVGEDALYGQYVEIDHGNGYTSIYRNAGTVKVDVGDEVTRGEIIFVTNDEKSYFGFQITKNEQYIDPMGVIEVNG